MVDVHALVAVGVNTEGHREQPVAQPTSAENGAAWLASFRDLVTRGLSGVQLVTSDARAGLVAAIGATLPGASWQRCRTHRAVPAPSLPEVVEHLDAARSDLLTFIAFPKTICARSGRTLGRG